MSWPDFTGVASAMAQGLITVCALALDDDGLAKRPVSQDYFRLTPADNASQDWSSARGIGIVLGRPSGCLAVIDVDDAGLADFLLRMLSGEVRPPRMVKTARGRLHVYVQELTPSAPADLEVRYQGRRCLVQLLGRGCQAAIPPTARYAWVDEEAQPLYGNVRDVWRRISLEYGLPYREATPYSFLRHERSRGPSTTQMRQAPR